MPISSSTCCRARSRSTGLKARPLGASCLQRWGKPRAEGRDHRSVGQVQVHHAGYAADLARGRCGSSERAFFPSQGRYFHAGRFMGGAERAVSEAARGPEACVVDRSARLTILCRCGHQSFSSRTSLARGSGNEPSTVLAEHHAALGSGNADSRPNRWDFRDGARSRRRSRVPGCVAAHPAPQRASPSYLPLRAGWAVCAWALRGCARSEKPFKRPDE
jgi:hypothetical protein